MKIAILLLYSRNIATLKGALLHAVYILSVYSWCLIGNWGREHS